MPANAYLIPALQAIFCLVFVAATAYAYFGFQCACVESTSASVQNSVIASKIQRKTVQCIHSKFLAIVNSGDSGSGSYATREFYPWPIVLSPFEHGAPATLTVNLAVGLFLLSDFFPTQRKSGETPAYIQEV